MTLRVPPAEIVANSTSPLLKIAPEWQRICLGEVAEITNGAAYKSALFNNEQRGMPLIRIRDVGQPEASTHFDGEYEERHVVVHGDLLVGMDGDFRAATWTGSPSLLNQRVCRLRVRSDEVYSQEFLAHVLQPYLDEIHKVTSAVTVKHLSSRTLSDLPIPMPERDEQDQIVKVLEEHFSRLDAAEASLEKAGRLCETLRRRIIVEAVPDETQRPEWSWTTVKEAGTSGLGRQRSPKNHHGSNMKPYLRVANVFEDRIDSSDVMSMNFEPQEFERFKLRNGDILLNEGQTPEWLGRPAIYRGEPADVAFTNSLIRFIPHDGISVEWALLVFRRHMHAGRFKKESTITTNIAHLTLGRFRSVEFPIPPSKVQDQIVEQTGSALDTLDRQEQQIQRAIAEGRALRRSILAAAFSGRLTSDKRVSAPELQMPASVNDLPPASAWAT